MRRQPPLAPRTFANQANPSHAVSEAYKDPPVGKERQALAPGPGAMSDGSAWGLDSSASTHGRSVAFLSNREPAQCEHMLDSYI